MKGSLTIAVDRDTGFVNVEGKGAWTEEQVEAHFQNLIHVLRQTRRRTGPARVLVDLREAFAQNPAVDDLVRHYGVAIYEPADKVAMLVSIDFAKEELQSVLEASGKVVFHDPVAAIRWLDEAGADRFPA